MKIISKFLFLLLLFFTLAGCGSFFGEEEAVGIASIETEELEDGSIKLIINYTDEEMLPLEVVIPKGEMGVKGNGIKDIQRKEGDDDSDNITTIVVTYTDTALPSVEFDIPHGTEIEQILVVDKEGYEIKSDENGNNYRVDEEGNSIEEEGKFYNGTRYLKIVYTELESSESDTKKSELFELPQGQSGQDGNGIEYIKGGRINTDGSIEEGRLNDDGSITIQFKYTQVSDVQNITIPSNKAIVDIKAIPSNGNEYILQIKYNTFNEDGSQEISEIKFEKPQVTQWLSGEGEPLDFRGNIGDFYYDEIGNDIWRKYQVLGGIDPNEGYWKLIVSLGEETKKCKVTFNVNGGLFNFGELKDPNSEPQTYALIAGTYFYASDKSFPDVYHPDGLQFLGWYTTDKILPTTTKFTDLTIVNTDITLYAIWGEK